MSFLTNLMGGAGGAAGSLGGGAAAGVAGAMGGGNPMANGLGQMFGSSGSHVSDIANRIGMGSNQVAAAGGAQPGYQPPPSYQPPADKSVTTGTMPPDPNNHLQLLDPQVLHALIQKFSNPTRGQNQMEQF